MRHYCTYFDRNYLTRGLVLHASMLRHAGPFVLHVLCLDDFTYRYLSRKNDASLKPISLAALEAHDPDLPRAKANRSRVEYYFTCTPALVRHVLGGVGPGDVVTYLDADLYFFGDPRPAFDELGDNSVLIVEHRFPARLEHRRDHGIYNVGFLCFRNDGGGRACVDWWRERCLEWCYDRLEDGKFGDQKYLDDWPRRFPGVVVLRHKGINLAPWNVDNYRLAGGPGGGVFVDDDPLLVYHFHGLKVVNRRLFNLGLGAYGVRLTPRLRKMVYLTYLLELQRLLAEVVAGGLEDVRYRRGSWLDQLRQIESTGVLLLVCGGAGLEVPVKPWVQLFLDWYARVRGVAQLLHSALRSLPIARLRKGAPKPHVLP
jgi:hypothetical protein